MAHDGGDTSQDLEYELNLLKRHYPWVPDEVASADSDREAQEQVRIRNEESARKHAAVQARWKAGRYFIDEAVTLIGAQRGLSEFVQKDMVKDMLRCAALPDDHKHKLIVRNPSTLVPVQHGVPVSIARIVYRSDVNAWLNAIGAGYQWEGDLQPAPAKRREKATTENDNNVIAWLKARGIDPLKMPSPPLGPKPWPLRKEIADALGISPIAVKKSMTRLRKDKRMKNA